MRRNRGATIGIGVFFGVIAFAITVFFVPPQQALVFGVFTAAVYILILSLIMDYNVKKYEKVDEAIEQDIVLKDTANYYSGSLLCNGVLFLTVDRLIFISFEKKPMYREEILLYNIKRATYGKIFRHIHGLKLIMMDSSVKGFVIKDIEPFLAKINEAISPNTIDNRDRRGSGGLPTIHI